MVGYAIETDDLSRSFGDRAAVDGLRLRVRAGSVFGYLGPNGAGKTTTLHLLLGILQPTRGTAFVAGQAVRDRPGEVRRLCGALLEHNGLYERLSAQENLEFHARLHGLQGADRNERIRQALDGIGLWERRAERTGTWSRGMKQRLAIARTLLHRPVVVFLDEPTAGFDPKAAADLRRDVRGLARDSGTTVFLTTHNLHEAEEVCDEVAVLQSGRIVAQGAPDNLRGTQRPILEIHATAIPATLASQLRRRKGVVAVEQTGDLLRLELDDAAHGSAIVKAVVASGAQVEEVVRPKATLEQSFLAILGAKA